MADTRTPEKVDNLNEQRSGNRADRRMEPLAFRVLIADDHAIVRAGLRLLLAECPDIAVTGEAASGQELLRKIRESAWDVVLLDIAMPGRSGLDILRQIKNERPKLAILILSSHDEGQYAIRALRAGAAGYLTRHCAPEELTGAVIRVARGGKYISPVLAEKLANAIDNNVHDAPHEALSNRELQVFQMLAAGMQVSQIGRALSLSSKTISTHRAKILKKMNMRSNAELMFYAIDNGLIDREQVSCIERDAG